MNKKQLIVGSLILFNLIFLYVALAQPNLEVSGIFYYDKEPYAIVNDKVVKIGDTLDGGKVIEIKPNFVKLQYGDFIYEKKLTDKIPEVKKTEINPVQEPIKKITDDREQSNRIILPEDVRNITLRLFYDSGSINGYVIIRNYRAEMCAVKFIEPALLIIYDRNGSQIWKKSLGFIDTKDFKLLELKNKDVVFVYEIKPFLFELTKYKKNTIFFEWGRLKASDEVSIF